MPVMFFKAYTKAGGRLNAFSAVQYAATGDLSATILVEDPITEVPEWGAALLALLSFLTLVLIAVMTLVLAQAALAYTPPDVVDNRQGNLL